MLMNMNLLFAIWANNFQLMNKYLVTKKEIRKFSPIFTIKSPVAAVFDAFETTAAVELDGAFSWICMSSIFRWITRVCISRFFASKTSMSATETLLDSWEFDISNCELETLMSTSFKACALRDLVATSAIILMKTLLARRWCLKIDMMILNVLLNWTKNWTADWKKCDLKWFEWWKTN